MTDKLMPLTRPHSGIKTSDFGHVNLICTENIGRKNALSTRISLMKHALCYTIYTSFSA